MNAFYNFSAFCGLSKFQQQMNNYTEVERFMYNPPLINLRGCSPFERNMYRNLFVPSLKYILDDTSNNMLSIYQSIVLTTNLGSLVTKNLYLDRTLAETQHESASTSYVLSPALCLVFLLIDTFLHQTDSFGLFEQTPPTISAQGQTLSLEVVPLYGFLVITFT